MRQQARAQVDPSVIVAVILNIVCPGAGAWFLCRHWIGSLQLILTLGVALPLLFFGYGVLIYLALLIWSELVVWRIWRDYLSSIQMLTRDSV